MSSTKVFTVLAIAVVVANLIAGIIYATGGNWSAAILSGCLALAWVLIVSQYRIIDRLNRHIDQNWTLVALLAMSLGRARREQEQQ